MERITEIADSVVADVILSVTPSQLRNWNWQCAVDNSCWDLNDDRYVNGVAVTIDLDMTVGHLVEVVARDDSAVEYYTVVVRGGPGADGLWNTVTVQWPGDAGTFFDRRAQLPDLAAWATETTCLYMYPWSEPDG